MPIVSLQVVPNSTGDFLGEKASGSSDPISAEAHTVGWSLDFFPLPSTDRGWIGRFELPIPNGSEITGASLTTWQSGPSTSGDVERQKIGLLAPDGIWDPQGTFSVAHYPTRSDIPWPERNSGTERPEKWFQGTPAFTATFPEFLDIGPMTFGENLTATHTVVGLVAKLQAWLDTYGSALRSGSATGHALPVAICWYRDFGTAIDASEYFRISSSQRPEAERPILTVQWRDPNLPGSIRASVDLRPMVRAKVQLR